MEQEYLTLFTAITKALEDLDLIRQHLIEAQQAAEEAYISRGDVLDSPIGGAGAGASA